MQVHRDLFETITQSLNLASLVVTLESPAHRCSIAELEEGQRTAVLKEAQKCPQEQGHVGRAMAISRRTQQSKHLRHLPPVDAVAPEGARHTAQRLDQLRATAGAEQGRLVPGWG